MEPKKKYKFGYKCPHCGASVWGRKGLFILCGNCSEELAEDIQMGECK